MILEVQLEATQETRLVNEVISISYYVNTLYTHHEFTNPDVTY